VCAHGQLTDTAIVIHAHVSVVDEAGDAIGTREKNLGSFVMPLLAGNHKYYKFGSPACPVMSDLARDHDECTKHGALKYVSPLDNALVKGIYGTPCSLGASCNLEVNPCSLHERCSTSQQLRLNHVAALLQWDSIMGRYHDACLNVAAMLTLVLSDARVCWRKRHCDRGKGGPPYWYESQLILPVVLVPSKFKGFPWYDYYDPMVPDGHARTQPSVYRNPSGVGSTEAGNQLVVDNDHHSHVTSTMEVLLDQGQMALVAAVRADTCYPHRRVVMGSRLAHGILYLDLALYYVFVVLVSTIIMVVLHSCHEGRSKMTSPRMGTVTSARTLDALVDHVAHSGVYAITPITVAAQLQDLLDLDCGIGLGDGDGFYILRSVTMHGEPPPPPEPPPWISSSPSTHLVEAPICSTTSSLGTHGDTSPRDGGEPTIPRTTAYLLDVIPVYGESIRFALRRHHKDAGRRILSYIDGEINLAHGVLSSTRHRDIICPRSQQ